MKHWPFRVVNENTKPKISVDYKGETKTFFPEEISSMVLTKMKETAEAFIGKVYQFAHAFIITAAANGGRLFLKSRCHSQSGGRKPQMECECTFAYREGLGWI